MNEEFRAVIHFCWLRRLTPQETFSEMQEAYEDNCPSSALVYKWYQEFEEGRVNLKDLPRQGRPLVFEKRTSVQNFVEQFPSSSCRYLALMLGMSKTTIKKILVNELHLKKLHYRWIQRKWMKAGEHIESPKHLIHDEKIMIFTAFSNVVPVLIYPMPPKINFTAQHFTNNILPLIKSEINKLDNVIF